MHHLIGTMLILLSANAFARDSAENFVLLDTNGTSHELFRSKEAKAVVIMAHGMGCPILDQNIATFNVIAADYKKRGVEFFFLNPNSEDSLSEIEKHMQEFNNQVPVLLDPTQVVTRSLEIKRTSEVIVIQPPSWKIVFRGKMDDGNRDYGAPRAASTKDYLRQALNSMLSNHLEQIPQSPNALGCLFNLAQDPPPSYTKTIAPILIAKCARCHDGSDPAAWKMTGYSSVRQWAPMIRETIMTKRMPPLWVEPGPDHFSAPKGLSLKEQIQLLNWLEAGAPAEKQRDPLASRSSPHDPAQGMQLRLPNPIEIPANGEVDYHYAKLLVADRDLYIRRFRGISGMGSIHHAVLFAAPDSIHEDPHKIRNEMDPLLLTSGIKQRIPEPYVFLLPKGYALYIEMHFRALGHTVKYDPVFELSLAKPDAKVRILRESEITTRNIHIPAGLQDYKMTMESTKFDHPVEVASLGPHMHLRGKSMKVEAVYPDGSVKMLLSVPKFEPHFPMKYWFAQPIKLPAGSRLVVSGSYDNSKSNPVNPDPERNVPWGWQMSDEMFLLTVTYADGLTSIAAQD